MPGAPRPTRTGTRSTPFSRRTAPARRSACILATDQKLVIDGTIEGTAQLDSDHIANESITYAKIQDVPPDRILGRSNPVAGTIQEIVCTAAGRALLDDADAAAQRGDARCGRRWLRPTCSPPTRSSAAPAPAIIGAPKLFLDRDLGHARCRRSSGRACVSPAAMMTHAEMTYAHVRGGIADAAAANHRRPPRHPDDPGTGFLPPIGSLWQRASMPRASPTRAPAPSMQRPTIRTERRCAIPRGHIDGLVLSQLGTTSFSSADRRPASTALT